MKKPTIPIGLLESDAVKRWCPHVRYPFEVATGIWVVINRRQDNDNPASAHCQTKECIYWERTTKDREIKEWYGRCAYNTSNND